MRGPDGPRGPRVAREQDRLPQLLAGLRIEIPSLAPFLEDHGCLLMSYALEWGYLHSADGYEYGPGDRQVLGQTVGRAPAKARPLCPTGTASLVTPDRALCKPRQNIVYLSAELNRLCWIRVSTDIS